MDSRFLSGRVQFRDLAVLRWRSGLVLERATQLNHGTELVCSVLRGGLVRVTQPDPMRALIRFRAPAALESVEGRRLSSTLAASRTLATS